MKWNNNLQGNPQKYETVKTTGNSKNMTISVKALCEIPFWSYGTAHKIGK